MAREVTSESPDFNPTLWEESLARGAAKSRLIFTGEKYLIPMDYAFNQQTQEEHVIRYLESSPQEYEYYLNWTRIIYGF